MKWLLALALALSSVACSGGGDDDEDTTPRDAGEAAVRDGGRDGGVVAVTCGDATCIHPLEYCRETPSAPCEARDGGTCGAQEEACRDQAVEGCTAPLARACVDLPANCTSCPCVILESPCGAQIADVSCNASPTEGVRVRCPFP
ncbi:MAG: hypothetical protein RMA76_36090 [Deltaproteobacteria bacterium]